MTKIKILYLIITHNNPEQTLRLVKAIKKGNPHSSILIHHDFQNSKYTLDPLVFERIENVRVFRNINSIPIRWGTFSFVQVVLNSMNWAIANALEFDSFVLLSGQDYPVQSPDRIERFLQDTDRDGFMEYFPVEDPPKKPLESGLYWSRITGIHRYFYQYSSFPVSLPKVVKSILFHLNHLTKWQPFVRFLIDRVGSSYGIRSFRSPFRERFRCYGGSTWFTISRECVLYISEFVNRDPDFVNYYQRTSIPDESFFQTILINQKKFKIVNNNLRFILWNSSNTSSPSILTIQDLDRLLESKRHFARKFDIDVDREIFDALDRELARPG